MKNRDIINVIEGVAPLNSMLDFDNAGLNVGDADAEVKKVLITLDVTLDAVRMATKIGANLIISHHPIIFYPVKRVVKSDVDGAIIMEAIKNDITLYSSHTNFDNAKGGITDKLIHTFNVFDVRAIEADGTGRMGFIRPMRLGEIVGKIGQITKDKTMRVSGNMDRIINKIAIINGAGGRDEMLADILEKEGVELFITGETKHSLAMLLKARGIALIDVEHYHAEQIFIDLMADLVSTTGVEVYKYYDSNPYNN